MSDSSDSGMILSATPPTLGNKKSKDVNVSRTRNRDKAGPAVDISDIVNADPAATTTGGDKSTSGTNNNTSGKNLESEMSRTFPPHPPFSTCYGGATTPRDDPSRHYANAYNRVANGNRNEGFHGRLSDDGFIQGSDSLGGSVSSEVKRINRRSRAPSPGYGGLEYINDEDEARDLNPRENSSTRYLREDRCIGNSPDRSRGHSRGARSVHVDEGHDDDNGFAAASETESDVFVPPVTVKSRRAVLAGRIEKNCRGEKNRREAHRPEKEPMYSHDDLINPRGRPTLRRPLPNQPTKKLGPSVEKDAYFNNIGRNLDDSRYSGAEMPWGVNKQPPAVPQDEVSDAALLKRGLKRGQGDKVAKRGYGANDPENIAIVNMKEQDGLSFEQIANILNERRVQAGKNPNLTITGCNGRYNRTAPLLFAAQGQEFTPLSQRKGHGKHGASLLDQAVFNNDTDIELVNCVKEVDSQKWYSVASMFSQRTGLPMNAKAAAIRFGML